MFKECNIFNDEHVMTAEKARGPEIVLMEGEELLLSENELEFLALGPKYCLLNTCSNELPGGDCHLQAQMGLHVQGG